MLPTASLIIRCHNEEQHIGRLLTGVMQQDVPDLELIIVDSGSTDATLAIAAQFPVKIVSIAPADFSFGRSLNVGCQVATGEFLIMASAHVYPVYDDWIAQLLAPFADPQVALVYGKQRGNAATKYAEHRIFAHWFPEQSNFNQPHPFCNNANAAVRRAIWLEQPYDEALTGLEDLDWAYRAMQRQYRIAYAADAEIIHVHNETWRRVFRRYQREAIALKHILPQERFTFTDLLRLLPANVLSDFYHAWRDRALPAKVVEIVLFRLMQFWGTYRGFANGGTISASLRRTFYYPSELERVPQVPFNPTVRKPIDYSLPHQNLPAQQ